MLTGYFHANVVEGESAWGIKYEDFPTKYVWNSKEKLWSLRERLSVNPTKIGRMSAIHPTSGDVFFLRVLLKNRPGALSFNDLKTVGGVAHNTFHSACVALNLCENDNQWIDCLQESVEIAHPWMIRLLFCNITLFCMPADPSSIYS